MVKRQLATSCRFGVVQQATGTQFYTALVAYLLSMRAAAKAKAAVPEVVSFSFHSRLTALPAAAATATILAA